MDNKTTGSKEDEQIWLNILTKYVCLKCLWDKSGKQTQVKKAWLELLKFAKTLDLVTNMQMLKSRIGIMRDCFERELNKVRECKNNRRRHRTRLYYFEVLKPIYKEQCRKINVCSDSPKEDENFCTKENTSNVTSANFIKNLKSKRASTTSQKKIACKILKKFSTLRSLWKSSLFSKSKKIKLERCKEWKELLAYARIFDKDLDMETLKVSISKMRNCHVRERKKIKEALSKGIIRKPKLYYFDALRPVYENECADIERCSDTTDTEEELIKATTETETEDDAVIVKRAVTDKEFCVNVLKQFALLKCLWDPTYKSDKYGDAKRKAWRKLLKFARNMCSNVDLKTLKDRIRFMRRYFLREVEKIEKAKNNGVVYETTLYYFDALKPVYQQQYAAILSDSNYNENSSDEECSEKVLENEISELNLSQHQKFWILVLKKYAAVKCLWKHKKHIPITQHKAWEKLLSFAKTEVPEINLETLKTRISNLRSYYTRELREIKEAQMIGIPCKPKLFFFGSLKPLYEKEHAAIENFLVNKKETDLNLTNKALTTEDLGLDPDLTYKWTPFQISWVKIMKEYVKMQHSRIRKSQNFINMTCKEWQQLLNFGRSLIPTLKMIEVKKRVYTYNSRYRSDIKRMKLFKRADKDFKSKHYYFDALHTFYQQYNKEGSLDKNNEHNEEKSENEPNFINNSLSENENSYLSERDECLSPNEVLSDTNEMPWSMEILESEVENVSGNGQFMKTQDVKEIESQSLSNEMDTKETTLDITCKSNDEDEGINKIVEQALDSIESNENPETDSVDQNSKRENRLFYIPHQREHINATKTIDHNSKMNIAPLHPNNAEYNKEPTPHTTCGSTDLQYQTNNLITANCCKEADQRKNEFKTLTDRLLLHFENMNEDQFLLAEKLIWDVVIFGRAKQLNIKSNVIESRK